MDRFLKIKEVVAITKLGKSTIYTMVRNGKFPHSVKLGESAVAWLRI